MKQYYDTDSNFKAYVDRYCKKEEITVEEALTHKIVKQVYKYYKTKEEDRI